MNQLKQKMSQEISNEMLCSISSTAALGVNGIEKMFMSLSDEILDVIYPSAVSKGVKVIESDGSYSVNLHVIVDLNADIPKVAREAQIKVIEAVEVISGCRVSEVNVHVKGCGRY